MFGGTGQGRPREDQDEPMVRSGCYLAFFGGIAMKLADWHDVKRDQQP